MSSMISNDSLTVSRLSCNSLIGKICGYLEIFTELLKIRIPCW